MGFNMNELIKSIRKVDKAIAENEKHISGIAANEAHLIAILKTAQEKERLANKRYIEQPTEKTQKHLEKSRDFSNASQRRVNLFENHSGQFINDNTVLREKRNTLLADLSTTRQIDSRNTLEDERQALLKSLYPQVIRLILLTSHLDGVGILKLSLNYVMEKYDMHFKQALDAARMNLKEQFEALDNAI